MNIDDLKATATAAVDAAVRALAQAPARTLSADGRDIKTQADLDAESAMLDVLRSASDLPVLSEEAGADGAFSPDATGWVVDPLDGTANFTRGIPMACTCLALLHDGDPLLGAVHDLQGDARWIGGPGLATTCNGSPVRCTRIDDPAQAVLATGFPRLFEFTHKAIAKSLQRFSAFKKIRMIGCAGLSLAWTSGGRMDLYMEDGVFLWDVAAGIALVRGAGGEVHCTSPDEQWRCDVVAGASALVDRFAVSD